MALLQVISIASPRFQTVIQLDLGHKGFFQIFSQPAEQSRKVSPICLLAPIGSYPSLLKDAEKRYRHERIMAWAK